MPTLSRIRVMFMLSQDIVVALTLIALSSEFSSKINSGHPDKKNSEHIKKITSKVELKKRCQIRSRLMPSHATC